MIDLELLPEVAFCETDAAKVEAAVIATYERIAGVSLYPGDPVRLFLEALAYLIAQQNFTIDWTGKQNLLSLAAGDYLDHVAAMVATTRMGSAAATTTLRFGLAEALGWDVVIPAGTRATADGSRMWATTAEAVIPAGELYADAPAACAQPGAAGNGLLPGQINRLVDRPSYVTNVANLYLTLGGTDIEGDERLRGRAQLAPERFSTCGPEGAYRYHAMTVSQDIIDAAVWSPEPGEIRLAPLLAGAAEPSSELLSRIYAAVTPKKVRPTTDAVRVIAPEAVPYTVAGQYWVLASHAQRAGQIAPAVAKAVADHIAWQRAKLGRAINPSQLAARVQGIEGVARVELSAPAYRALDPWQVAVADEAALTYGGLDNG